MLSDYAYKLLMAHVFRGEGVCPGCGERYVKTNRSQIYCSKHCWYLAKRAKAVE